MESRLQVCFQYRGVLPPSLGALRTEKASRTLSTCVYFPAYEGARGGALVARVVLPWV